MPRSIATFACLCLLLACSWGAAFAAGGAGAPDSAATRYPNEQALRHYLEGRWLDESGDVQGAMNELTRTLSLDPRAGSVLLRLSEVASRAGDPARSLELARRARDLEPANARALWLEGAALFNLERADEALIPLAEAARVDSFNAEYQRTLARVAESLQRPDIAEGAYRRAVRLDDGDGESWFQIATAAARAGRFREADSALSIASEINPARPGSLFLRAYVRENLGDLEEAIASYRHHLGIHDTDQTSRRRLIGLLERTRRIEEAYREAQELSRARPEDADVLQVEADLALQLRKTDEGIRTLARMRDLDKDDAGLVMRSIVVLARNDRDREAIELAQRWAGAHGSDQRSRLMVARARAMAGQLDSAAAITRREVAAAPDSLEPRRLLARVLQDGKRWREAAAEWQALRERQGDDPGLLLDLGYCREQGGDVPGAVEAGREALALAPDHPAALNFLGYVLTDHAIDLVEAERLLRRALVHDPGNGAIQDSWGWLLYRLGRFEEARAALERAVEMTAGDPTVHEHLGDVYAQLQLVELARKQYQACLAADSPNSRVRGKLEALRQSR